MGRSVSIAASAIKSIQEGYVSAVPSNGSGRDGKYVDVTISAVNTAKAVVEAVGGFGIDAPRASAAGQYIGLADQSAPAAGRLLNSTTLRLHCALSIADVDTAVINWRVVEYS
ncbi:MAG: hypothetical protein LCH99_10930 [Proteobacteria bacterium]|nr:hypothetical protein [Pseudomonadota bacterium]